MKMLETQVGRLVGRLSTNEGKLPGHPQCPETAKAIQTHSGIETENPKHSVGARKPKSSTEMEEFAKEEVTEIVTEEPDFEMPKEDTRNRNSSHATSEINLTIILRSLWRLCVG
jgi:hypothetical protein